MTAKERKQVEEMYTRYRGLCFVSGKPATQRAHCIGNTKANRSRYGNDIVDNPLNWLPAAGLKENALIDLGKNTILLDHMADLILLKDREAIEVLVSENIKRKQSKL